MNFKKTLRACIAFSMTALLFASCTNDDLKDIDDNNVNLPKGELTCFSQAADAPAPDPISGPQKTFMDNAGHHYWMNGDAIWVVKENDPVRSDRIAIRDGKPQEADFFFDGVGFGQASYPILYVGDAETCNTVTIAAEQIQSEADNSEHYAASGDCAKTIATQDPNKKNVYSFEKLVHEAAYIYFEPYMEAMPGTGTAKLKKLTITEKNGKNICGTYDFNQNDGLDVESVTDGGSEIVVYCGKNAKAVEAKKMSADTTYNGFPLYTDRRPAESRVFLVIQPGKFDLDITYEIAYGLMQVPEHGSGSAIGYDWNNFYIEEKDTVIKMDLKADLKKNTFYYMRHKLHVDDIISPDYTYPFDQYYMWGAKKWFWDGVTDYPVHWNESQSENAPQSGTDRWFRTNVSKGHTVTTITTTGNDKYKWQSSTVTTGDNIVRHDQASNSGGVWATGKALTANQASCYVMYGDPHYDNTTKWVLEGYNGEVTYCVGGVWLKTKAAIERDEGITFPGNDDSGKFTNLAAPFTPGPKQNNQDFNGFQYNLRYCAPWSNYRKAYTNRAAYVSTGEWKKPWELDPNKRQSDYFFLPALGHFEYNHQGSEGIPTLTLVGAQGFYWTRTPVTWNFGSSKYYYTGAAPYSDPYSGFDNAFYINIHFEYLALSWQQNSIYMKTGMQVATWDTSQKNCFK